MCNPMTPPWLALTPLPFQVSIYSRYGSHRTNGSLRTNLKYLALSCYGHHFRAFWCILVHFGAPHVQPHGPSMTCSDSSALPNVHLLQKWITLVTQDKFRNTLICDAMVTILVPFDAFWYTSCVTPWPLNDLLWLLYPSKCPSTPEMDLISHSGLIQITQLWHAMYSILVHFGAFGAFWCT